MGVHLTIAATRDADARAGACAPSAITAGPDALGHFSADVFADVAERIRRSMQGAIDTPVAIAALVADALEQTSGERIRDQARLARQMLLWHRACPPERARTLTVAALADRAGALRRSVPRRRLERGPGE